MATLQAGIVVTAPDGSVKDSHGTYVVIFKAGNSELQFQGPVDYHPLLIQSYRAELTGLLAIQALLKCLSDNCKEEIMSEVIAHIDNISAVAANNQVGPSLGVAAHTKSDIDLLQEIWSYQSSTCVQAVWVEAHQDTKYKNRDLSQEAVLNCKVDADASAFIDSNNDTRICSPVLSTTIAILRVNDIVVTSKMKEVLRDSASCVGIYYYIKIKTGWAHEQMDWVQWPAQSNAFDGLSLYNKIQVLKFQHNWLPTAKWLQRLYPT
eukprot:15355529-Ditylum_brightwellii.AAC.1